MWAWFLDWSKTARTVIKNRNFHVMLGLVSHHGMRSADASVDVENFSDDQTDDEFLEATASGV